MHNQNGQPGIAPEPTQTPPPSTPVSMVPDPLANPPEAPKETKREGLKSILSTVGIFLLAPIIAVILTAFVFQSYEVDGQSMEITLQNQDRLVIYKLPKTWSRIWRSDYMPARDEVIVFTKHAGDVSEEGDKQLIKRVVGVPGDHVVVKDGSVTVYNEENPDGYNPDEGKDYAKGFTRTEGNIDITVDEGEVFVLGDNRNNSLDSRYFGPIKTTDISGELVLRIYPFNKFEAY